MSAGRKLGASRRHPVGVELDVQRPFAGGKPRVPLAVLIVEGSDAAAELAVGALENDVDVQVRWRRVQDAPGMTAARREESSDVVLSEHRIADFDAFKAIEVLGTSGVEVPLIVVSGAISEETAVGAIRAGAADLVSKNHLDRLGVVVARCLRHQVEDQRARAMHTPSWGDV